ncbi:MAG TPA: DUF72 domain-containing protein [Gaiellaceae bacterium]|nr:DUF72 domain-containing protein [Gaiellaceae bacterium]
MGAVRIGTCSWADAGLLSSWYPASVRDAAGRLGYYAERFDVVEADSPFYRLPSPETTARWAERTPPGFVFHVKASGEMTGHRRSDRDEAFRAFREAVAPIEAAGKLRAVLLQYPPWLAKSREAARAILEARDLLDPLSALVEFRHVSWTCEDELPTTLELCRRNGLALVSLDAPANALPRVAEATGPLAYVRFHGRNRETWFRKAKTSAERFDWLYAREELAEWVEPLRQLDAEADEVYALFNNNRDDFAPRSAQLLRGLLDESGIEATGGVEPEPAAPTLF